MTATGYHQDRFLILPPRLQQKNVPKSFASKNTLARYIQSNFPGMDADAFFASFSWKIPALFQPANKGKIYIILLLIALQVRLRLPEIRIFLISWMNVISDITLCYMDHHDLSCFFVTLVFRLSTSN